MPPDETVSELLPDYVRGTLSDADRARVDAAVAADQALAAELATFQGVSAALKADAGPVTGREIGWARLSRAVDAHERATAPGVITRWQVAAAVFAVLAIGQAAWIVGTGPRDEGARFTTAGEAAEAWTLQVMFAPTATEADIRALLDATGGQIVAGPSAIGLYRVRFESEAAMQSALEALSTAPDVVEGAAVER